MARKPILVSRARAGSEKTCKNTVDNGWPLMETARDDPTKTGETARVDGESKARYALSPASLSSASE